METDYWSKPASKVAAVTVINDVVIYPDMPERRESMRNMSDFDNFQNHTDTSLMVYVYNSKVDDYFSESIHKNAQCLEKVDQWISINTWYGVTYSSDF
jgi:hypothetical protein